MEIIINECGSILMQLIVGGSTRFAGKMEQEKRLVNHIWLWLFVHPFIYLSVILYFTLSLDLWLLMSLLNTPRRWMPKLRRPAYGCVPMSEKYGHIFKKTSIHRSIFYIFSFQDPFTVAESSRKEGCCRGPLLLFKSWQSKATMKHFQIEWDCK